MKNCPRCNAPLEDDAAFCGNCGLNMAENPVRENAAPEAPSGYGGPGGYPPTGYGSGYGYPPPVSITDHTAEFDPKDISDNKVLAMIPYMLGTIGVIISLLGSHDSKFVSFHVRQALKISVVSVLLTIIGVLLCWTVVIPFVVGVCAIILVVLRIIAFFQVCFGKAKEPAIISSLGFLK